ncbi:N-formylglutamate amidohydrolase [Rubellimicrobium sp. CFH 75288]|uniref:N-formylglutamate amidohydrolase n=1 Tax=Rubellimicrobium sp. CFH 75288 TaxID=2697034 RepID=UPI001411B6B0|nr:N-formylglutamate amidohydrolase [Rubellimicrobium sp. CFH 75288]NAZ37228.1 N-formylglutamate amidohydrolase [Rubellimicrobium sp. CFH 75288]
MTSAFHLSRPSLRTTSVVFASPHSGRFCPAGFLARAELDPRTMRSSEDAFVDLLFGSAPRHGAPLIAGAAARAFVDLNRAPDELDPALIEGVRRPVHNPRVASGLGVIPRVVAGGRPIHRGRIALAEAQDRIDLWWRPYHETLAGLLVESHAQFGEAILIDCHSMPHEALDSVAVVGGRKPDVVLGDRFGAAASPVVMDRVEAAFTAAGLRVLRNMPFAGAYSVQHYGRPSRRQHAVQVEIDRSLYMDERLVEPHEGFEPFRRLLEGVVADLTAIGRPEGLRLAAE